MKNLIEVVNGMKLAENEKGQLKQNERNALRGDLIDALVEVFADFGITSVRIEDGVGIELPNAELGSIPVVIGATIKDLAFDVLEANEDFVSKQAEKVKAEQAKAEAKAKALAEKEALKASRANKKKA